LSTRAWKSVVDALVAEDSKFVFGLTANPWEFWDYLADTNIKPILVRHEISSVFMAMAHARLTGRPGICLNSPGPGIANMFPGFLEAYAGCLPLIAPSPCGAMKVEGMGQFQETDFTPSFRPVSKWSYRVTVPQKIPWAMRRAFSLAVAGKPGPIFLEIPMDVGNAIVESPTYRSVGLVPKSRPDADDVRRALELIGKSERPSIVAGGGVVSAKAFKELIIFAESLAIPVLTTPSGRGSIPEDHPLSVGLMGLYRTRVAKKVYEESDLLISIGSRMEEFQTAGWDYYPAGAKFIQIDIDPSEIGKNFLPDVALVGDARLALGDLISGITEMMRIDKLRSERAQGVAVAKREYEALIAEECKTEETPLKTKRIVRELNEVFGANTILANENGSQDLWSYYCPYYKVLDVGGCMGMAEQTCFGVGVIGSIGAKLTRPDMNVVCPTGDGAFQFAMSEVATAVQYGAPVTWVVLNNFSLGWEKYYQKYWIESGRYVNTEFTFQPDFVKFAEANKCYGETITNASDIRPALTRAKENTTHGVPAILDFRVSTFDFPEGFNEFYALKWGKTVRPLPK
jgi:acetolactate synthase-1/2/3 large subunit